MSLNSVINALRSSNAFGEGEIEALVNKYKSDVVNEFETLIDTESEALYDYMSNEDTENQKLSSTNQANCGG